MVASGGWEGWHTARRIGMPPLALKTPSICGTSTHRARQKLTQMDSYRSQIHAISVTRDGLQFKGQRQRCRAEA
jgi:hypothetical protein